MINQKIELYKNAVFNLEFKPIDKDRKPLKMAGKHFRMYFFNTDTDEKKIFNANGNFIRKGEKLIFYIAPKHTKKLSKGNVEFELYIEENYGIVLIEKGTIVVKNSILTKKK